MQNPASTLLQTEAHSLYTTLRAMVRNGDDNDYRLDKLTGRAWQRYTRRNPNYRKLVNSEAING